MKLSQIAFRISFFAFAVIYFTVLSEFVTPQQFNIKFDINFDALFLTCIVLGYFYVFLRRTKF